MPVSRNSRKLFGSEKPFAKLRPACSVKLVFSYVVKGIKIKITTSFPGLFSAEKSPGNEVVKITAKFRASRRLSFEDTKRIMSPEMRPKSLGTVIEERTIDNNYKNSTPNLADNSCNMGRRNQ